MILIKIFILFIISFVLCEDIEIYKKKHPLPKILENTDQCPLNACEALKVISQYFLLTKTAKKEQDKHEKNEENKNSKIDDVIKVNPFMLEMDFEKRLRHVEKRLKSIEQPIWKLKPGNVEEWNRCTASMCRCNPDTKTFACWNTDLKTIPIEQILPMDMINM